MFVVYIVILKILESAIAKHSFRVPLLAILQQINASTEIPREYTDHINIFSPDIAIELLQKISINKHSIKLVKRKQPLYKLIYNLGQVQLEILKIYLETHLTTSLIWLLKSPIATLIFFHKKPNGNFCFYVNYQGLNNLTMKN